ncbi:hypothetical protein PUN28_007803 [Cardiocondyla obscurior]|uniref:Uncharacterized protein n=1 Tax=Cardiocondyla obscurior TaxID=286306 RepID=A0AAW2FXZ9_9HYME
MCITHLSFRYTPISRSTCNNLFFSSTLDVSLSLTFTISISMSLDAKELHLFFFFLLCVVIIAVDRFCSSHKDNVSEPKLRVTSESHFLDSLLPFVSFVSFEPRDDSFMLSTDL